MSAVSLVGLEGGGNVAKLGRYANYLRSILPHPDVALTEMTAKAIGQSYHLSLGFVFYLHHSMSQFHVNCRYICTTSPLCSLTKPTPFLSFLWFDSFFSAFSVLCSCVYFLYVLHPCLPPPPPPPAGQLALAEGTYTAEYVEFEVRRALEWIGGNEHKRLAAVSFL